MRRKLGWLLVVAGAVLFSGCATTKTPCAGGKAPCATAGKTPCDRSCGKMGDKYTNFGKPLKLDNGDALCIKKVLADPKAHDGKFFRVAGKVDSVCAKRGCWLRLGDGESKETLFIKFTCPVKGRLIPMDAVGKFAFIEGTLNIVEISEEEARHYKEDAGASKEEIAKIVGPQSSVRMSAPAARIAGV